MTAIGIDRFRRMLKRLLEKSRDQEVYWRQNSAEKTLSVGFKGKKQISLYHHLPPDAPEVVGAILRFGPEIVITLEAEEGEEDWPLLHDLYQEAESAVDRRQGDVESLEEELSSHAPVGRSKKAPQKRKTEKPASEGVDSEDEDRYLHAAGFGAEPSLEDLEDGDSPLDEDS